MALSADLRDACLEVAAAPGSEAEAVLRFFPEPERDRVLAMEALTRSLRDIPRSVSEPAVGAAKLAWWQKELAESRERGSQHPVVRALLETDALARLDDDAFGDYLHGLVQALQDEPVQDSEALRRGLRSTVGQEARLFAGEGGPMADSLVNAALAARLLELVRGLDRVTEIPAWLPLDLVARHGFRPGTAQGSAASAPLVADLASLAMSWRKEAPTSPRDGRSSGARFLVLRDIIVGRRLEWAHRRPEQWLEKGSGLRVTDVIATWRGARQLGLGTAQAREG